MTKLSARTDIPALEGGWVNLTEAAGLLGLTRSYVYKCAGEGKFNTLRRIGSQSVFVVNEREIQNMIDQRTKPVEDEPVVEEEEPPSPIVEREPDPIVVPPQQEQSLSIDEILAQIA